MLVISRGITATTKCDLPGNTHKPMGITLLLPYPYEGPVPDMLLHSLYPSCPMSTTTSQQRLPPMFTSSQQQQGPPSYSNNSGFSALQARSCITGTSTGCLGNALLLLAHLAAQLLLQAYLILMLPKHCLNHLMVRATSGLQFMDVHLENTTL